MILKQYFRRHQFKHKFKRANILYPLNIYEEEVDKLLLIDECKDLLWGQRLSFLNHW